jgi:hypothetical protein
VVSVSPHKIVERSFLFLQIPRRQIQIQIEHVSNVKYIYDVRVVHQVIKMASSHTQVDHLEAGPFLKFFLAFWTL